MQKLYKTILMIILILGITTSLFAIDGEVRVLYLTAEITASTSINTTEDGVEVSSNLLGFNYTIEKEGAFKVITVIAS